MKHLRKWVPALSALLLTVLGALLPYAIAQVQDHYIENRVESRSFAPVNLTLVKNGSVLEVLKQMSYCAAMSWDGKTGLTGEEVIAAAAEVIAALPNYGLLPSQISGDWLKDIDFLMGSTELEPVLMVSTTEAGFSSIVWACHWHVGVEALLLIDDASGKIVAADMDPAASAASAASAMDSSSSSDSVKMAAYVEHMTMQAYLWREFFAAYYGLDSISIEEPPRLTDYSVEFTLIFDPGSGEEPIEIPMVFYENGCMILNHGGV